MCRGSTGCSGTSEKAMQARPASGWPQVTLLGVERRRLQRSEASQWKEWHVPYTLFREVIDEAIIGSVCDVVKVLHADYLRNSLSLGELLRADVAQTQMTNESLALEFG